MTEYRPIETADMDALGEVFYEADDELNERRPFKDESQAESRS